MQVGQFLPAAAVDTALHKVAPAARGCDPRRVHRLTLAVLVALAQVLATDAHAERRIGDRVRIGGSSFVIWNFARTGVMPKGVTASPDGRWLYVSNFGRRAGDNISIFRADPLEAVGKVSYPGNAIETTLSADGRRLFSTNKVTHSLDVIDVLNPTRPRYLRAYRLGGFPKYVVLERYERRAYVSLWSDNTIARLELDSGRMRRLRHGQQLPRGLALTGDGRRLYVANNRGSTVSVIDTRRFSVEREIKVRGRPRHVVVSRDQKRLYVASIGWSAIAIVDLARSRVSRYIYVGKWPKTIVESHDGRFVYSADYGGHSLSIVDTRTWRVAQLALDLNKASGLAVHPGDDQIYVTGWCSGDIWAIRRFDAGEAITRPPRSHPRRRVCRDCPSTMMGCPRKGRIQARR